MKHQPHVDCPFCWSNKGRDDVLAGCALCWQARHVPIGVAVEFSLMGLPKYDPLMTSSYRRRAEWKKLKQKLRALRRRHGLKTEKWK